MALYLKGNSHHNMLGVYYLPILYAASDLKQPVKKVKAALKKLCDISYCKYDSKTQYIWVYNMALEQFGGTVEDINAGDNRIKAIQAIWNSLPVKIEFLSEIYDKYRDIFNLKDRFSYFSYSSCSSCSHSADSSCNEARNTLAAKKNYQTVMLHSKL